jgi:hypothetical protein
MSTLNSYCPALGSEIDVYLYANRDISMTVQNFTLRSKVVGVYVHTGTNADWLLAWTGSNTPSKAYSSPGYKHVGAAVLAKSFFTKDVDHHSWYCWVNGNIEIAAYHALQPMTGTGTAPTIPVVAPIPLSAPVPTSWTNVATKQLVNANNLIQTLKIGEVMEQEKQYGISKRSLEAPCPNATCGKMNNVGSSKCWWCEGKL